MKYNELDTIFKHRSSNAAHSRNHIINQIIAKGGYNNEKF